MSAEDTAEASDRPEQDLVPPENNVARNQRRPLQRAANWDDAAEMLRRVGISCSQLTVCIMHFLVCSPAPCCNASTKCHDPCKRT